jgi:hypothetical protein
MIEFSIQYELVIELVVDLPNPIIDLDIVNSFKLSDYLGLLRQQEVILLHFDPLNLVFKMPVFNQVLPCVGRYACSHVFVKIMLIVDEMVY